MVSFSCFYFQDYSYHCCQVGTRPGRHHWRRRKARRWKQSTSPSSSSPFPPIRFGFQNWRILNVKRDEIKTAFTNKKHLNQFFVLIGSFRWKDLIGSRQWPIHIEANAVTCSLSLQKYPFALLHIPKTEKMNTNESILLNVLLPPMAVARKNKSDLHDRQVQLTCLLTLLFWFPGKQMLRK